MAAGQAASPAWRVVCGSDELVDGGLGVRFAFDGPGGPVPAFVVRSEGVVRAYVNRCSHVPSELDWQPGRFLDESGTYLVCATHGAMYLAQDGSCAGGPCNGGLEAIGAREQQGEVSVWLACGISREPQ